MLRSYYSTLLYAASGTLLYSAAELVLYAVEVLQLLLYSTLCCQRNSAAVEFSRCTQLWFRLAHLKACLSLVEQVQWAGGREAGASS